MKQDRKRVLGRWIALMLTFMVVFGSINWNFCVPTFAAQKGKMTLNVKSTSTYVGGKVRLKVASVTPKKISKKVTWSTSNKKVATVSNKGIVTGKKPGTAKITATLTANKSVKATCKVKVYKATKKLVLTSESSLTMKKGEKSKVSAKVKSPKTGASPVTWKSKNTKVATVTNKGVVRAVAKGTTVITGTSGKKSVKVTVTVEENADATTPTPDPTPNPTPNPIPTPTPTPDPTPSPTPDQVKIVVNNCENDIIDTTEEKITISGTVEAGASVKGLTCEYHSYEDDAKSMTVEGTSTWTTGEIPLSIGTNYVTINVCDDTKVVGTKELIVTRKSTVLTVSDNTVILTAGSEEDKEVISQIYDNIIDFWTTEDAEGNVEQVHILVEQDNPMCQSVLKGEWEKGSVYYMEPNEYFYTGLSLVLDDMDEDFSGVTDAQYDPATCKVIHAHAAELTNLLKGELCISAEGLDSEKPLAFVKMVEFSPFAETGDDEISPETTTGDITGKNDFAYFRIGFDNNDSKDISFKCDTSKLLTQEHKLGFSGNVVIYDKDKNPDTTNDQIVVSGNMDISNINPVVGVEKTGLFNLRQVICYLDYTLNRNVRVSVSGTGDLKGLVKEINAANGYSAKSKNIGIATIQGINFDDVIILGVAGYSVEQGWLVRREGGAAITDIDPFSILLYIGIDLNGELKVQAALDFKDTVYQKNGVNIQDIEFVGKHGSAEQNKSPIFSEQGKLLNKTYQVDIYNISGESASNPLGIPKYTIFAQAGGSANLYLGPCVGVMPSFWGITIGKAQIGVGEKMSGSLMGYLLASNYEFQNMEDDLLYKANNIPFYLYGEALAQLDSRIGFQANGKVYLKLSPNTEENNGANNGGNEADNPSVENFTLKNSHVLDVGAEKFWEISSAGYSTYKEKGTVVDEKGDPMEGVEVKLKKKNGLNNVLKTATTDENGNFAIAVSDGDSSTAGEYVICISKEGYKDVTEEIKVKDLISNFSSFDSFLNRNKTYTMSERVKQRGTYLGMQWFLYEGGLLEITGEYDSQGSPEDVMWTDVARHIKSVIITAKNVEETEGWFEGCENLQTIDFSQFDTSKVTNMRNMFGKCTNLSSLDLSGFDTGNVTDMNGMFWGCNNLSSLNLNGFDTSKVTDMEDMFYACWNLNNLDVSSFDTGKVTDMSRMFGDCRSLDSLDLSFFDTSEVTDMNCMFSNCNSLSSLDLSGFDTSKVTDMDRMFSSCSSLSSLALSDFDTSEVTDMEDMFWGCSSLSSLDVSSFDTGKVTNMYGMFYGCSIISSLDLKKFNTSNVTDMGGMFLDCSSVSSLDVSSFDTGKVANMSGMFYGCSNLSSLDLKNFDTSNVTTMGSMFYSCSNLSSLNLSSFDTSKVTNMNSMFYRCSNLSGLNLRNFDTSNVTDMCLMFYYCSSISILDLSGFDMSSFDMMKLPPLTSYYSMFEGCSNLNTIEVPLNLTEEKVTGVIGLPCDFEDASGNVYYALPLNVTESFTITRVSE